MFQFFLRLLVIFWIVINDLTAVMKTFDKNKEFSTESVTFCAAHQRCFELGKSKGRIGYMIGKDYHALDLLQPLKSDVWLNYHALKYQELPTNSSVWSFGETSEKQSKTIFDKYFKKDGPTEYDRFSVYTNESVIKRTNAEGKTKTFACGFQLVNTTDSKIKYDKFVVDETGDKSKLFFRDPRVNGCFDVRQNTSRIACAKK